MLSIAQSTGNIYKLALEEYYQGEDTIVLIINYKTGERKIKDGSFSATFNGKGIVHGQYKDNKKTGMWYYSNDDMTTADSTDYSVIHNMTWKEYEKVYYNYKEGMQRPDIGECLSNMNVRYPILDKVKSIQGTVSYQFILNAENKITNIDILETYNDDMAMEVVYALRNLKFPNAVTLNGKPVNYRITGGICFDAQDFTSKSEPQD